MTEIVARLVILHVVLELILGRAVLLLIALSVATVAAAIAASSTATVLSLEDSTSLCGSTVLALRQGSTVAVAGCTSTATAVAITLRGQIVAGRRLVALRWGQIVVGGRLRGLIGGQILVLRYWWLRLRPGGQADEQRNRCKALREKEKGMKWEMKLLRGLATFAIIIRLFSSVFCCFFLSILLYFENSCLYKFHPSSHPPHQYTLMS